MVFTRIAGVYDDMGHSAFLAEQIAGVYEHRIKSHLYPGMLCAAQSYVHLDDLTAAFARVIERREQLPPELPILIGEPDALGYDEIQDVVHQAIHGKGWTTVQIPKPVPKIGAWCRMRCWGAKSTETTPTDACQHFYDCPQCRAVLMPLRGDCCVFCSYGDVACPPPIQEAQDGGGSTSCCAAS